MGQAHPFGYLGKIENYVAKAGFLQAGQRRKFTALASTGTGVELSQNWGLQNIGMPSRKVCEGSPMEIDAGQTNRIVWKCVLTQHGNMHYSSGLWILSPLFPRLPRELLDRPGDAIG
jgi:hypothetical protein